MIAVADEASKVAAAAGLIESGDQAMTSYATGLRYTVAFSVGVAITLGVLRILMNWSIHYMIMI